MQQILGYMRRAVDDYKMIKPGDKIAVGISGGKDSMVLLKALSEFQKYFKIPFDLVGITIDPGFENKPGDFSQIQKFADEIGVEYIVKRTNLSEIIFDIRKESNPCSLCARLRRGALHNATVEAGCNKIALGHHRDDAGETLLMNLFQEGRLACFSPVSYLSRKDITMIRPLIFIPERILRNTSVRLSIPIVKSKCPADGVTMRQEIKQFISDKEKDDPGFSKKIFGALKRSGISGW